MTDWILWACVIAAGLALLWLRHVRRENERSRFMPPRRHYGLPSDAHERYGRARAAEQDMGRVPDVVRRRPAPPPQAAAQRRRAGTQPE